MNREEVITYISRRIEPYSKPRQLAMRRSIERRLPDGELSLRVISAMHNNPAWPFDAMQAAHKRDLIENADYSI